MPMIPRPVPVDPVPPTGPRDSGMPAYPIQPNGYVTTARAPMKAAVRPLTHRPLRARSPHPFRLFQQARQNVPQWLLTFSKRVQDSSFCPIVMLGYKSLRLSWFCGWGNLSTVHSLGCSCGVDVGEDVLFIALVVYPFHNKFRRHSICPLPAKNAPQL